MNIILGSPHKKCILHLTASISRGLLESRASITHVGGRQSKTAPLCLVLVLVVTAIATISFWNKIEFQPLYRLIAISVSSTSCPTGQQMPPGPVALFLPFFPMHLSWGTVVFLL